ncbi:phosphatidylserine decarboxylase, partial [Oleoguttula sp. CCFEE 5521]
MPRPHLPAHLSSTLQRFKSKDNVSNGNGDKSSPPSRQSSPPRNGAMKSTNGNGSVSSATSQGDHKNMGLVLRVQVLKGRNLAPKDKSGTSDPFL